MTSQLYTLGITTAGEHLDLDYLLNFISLSGKKFQKISNQFLSENPEWKQLAKDASSMYYKTLAVLPVITPKNPPLIQQYLRLSETESQLTDRGAMMLMVGTTHYLESAGFNIENPTSYKEITTKLNYIIQPALRISIEIIFLERGTLIVDMRDLTSAVLAPSLMNFYTKCFEAGASLGYLIAYAHFNGVDATINHVQSGSGEII